MIIALHWAEWLRRPEVERFEAASPVMVEDWCQHNLADDRTAFVFDDTDRPMVQCLASAWQGRFSVRQLVEIYNALVAEQNRVRAFQNRDAALGQIAHRLVQMGKDAAPRRITQEDINMEPQAAVAEHEQHTNSDEAAAEAAQQAAESPAELKRQEAKRKAEEKEAAKKAAADKKVADKKAKDDAKEAKKAEAAAAKPKGVIVSLMELLSEKKDGEPVKRSVDELFAKLLDKFPERGEAMKTTVRVQLVRLGKEGRMAVHSEDRVDTEGKKIAGKAYWGEAIPKAA